MACSRTRAAPRSRPIPLSVPKKAAGPHQRQQRAAPAETVAQPGHRRQGDGRASQAGGKHHADRRRGKTEAGEIQPEQHAHHAGGQRAQKNGDVEQTTVAHLKGRIKRLHKNQPTD